jgi:hypothetical protein
VPREPHRLADLRSLALHREIARRVRQDPALLERVKRRVERWVETGEVSTYYARAWQELLDGPSDALFAALENDEEQARALRQASPFLGITDARRRWEIWRQTGAVGGS